MHTLHESSSLYCDYNDVMWAGPVDTIGSGPLTSASVRSSLRYFGPGPVVKVPKYLTVRWANRVKRVEVGGPSHLGSRETRAVRFL